MFTNRLDPCDVRLGPKMEGEPNVKPLHVIRAKIYIPVPLADTLKCGYCDEIGTGGKSRARGKLKMVTGHITKYHPETKDDQLRFRCTRCDAEFDTFKAGSAHLNNSCNVSTLDSFIADEHVILWYREDKPSRCPHKNDCPIGTAP